MRVPVEHQHLLQAARLDQVGTAVRASSRARTGCTTWVTRSAAALRAAICTSAGFLSSDLVRLADLVREGGREQQVLPDRRQQRDDALDVGHEAHVQHAVGLVEDQHRDLVEHHRLVLHVVEQPAGRGDQDLHAAPQLRDLRVHVGAAVDDRGARSACAWRSRGSSPRPGSPVRASARGPARGSDGGPAKPRCSHAARGAAASAARTRRSCRCRSGRPP